MRSPITAPALITAKPLTLGVLAGHMGEQYMLLQKPRGAQGTCAHFFIGPNWFEPVLRNRPMQSTCPVQFTLDYGN